MQVSQGYQYAADKKKRTLKRGWAVYSDGKSAQISPFATIKRVYALKLEMLQHKWQPNGRPLLCSSAANTIFSFGQFSSVASLDVNGWGGGTKGHDLGDFRTHRGQGQSPGRGVGAKSPEADAYIHCVPERKPLLLCPTP